jgi:hypothetical protein
VIVKAAVFENTHGNPCTKDAGQTGGPSPVFKKSFVHKFADKWNFGKQ